MLVEDTVIVTVSRMRQFSSDRRPCKSAPVQSPSGPVHDRCVTLTFSSSPVDLGFLERCLGRGIIEAVPVRLQIFVTIRTTLQCNVYYGT